MPERVPSRAPGSDPLAPGYDPTDPLWPIPAVRRERDGTVYRGHRLLLPTWRRRLTIVAIIAVAVTACSIFGGLAVGHLVVRLLDLPR